MRMANHERPRNHCRQLHAGSSPCRPASGKSSLPCRHRRNHHLRPPRFRPEAPLQNHCCAACRHPSPSRKRLPHPLSRPTLILTQKTTALPIPDILPAMNARTGRAALGFAKADISVGRCLRFQTTEMFAAEYCARPQSTNARTQRHVLIYQLAVQAAGSANPSHPYVFPRLPARTGCAERRQDNLRRSRRHASIFRSHARALDESGYIPLCQSGHLRWAMFTLPNSRYVCRGTQYARPPSANARTQRHVLIYQLAVQAAGGREAFPAVHTVFLACPFKTECAGSWQDNLRHSRQHASIFRSNARALDESGYAPLCKSGHLRWAMLTLPNS